MYMLCGQCLYITKIFSHADETQRLSSAKITHVHSLRSLSDKANCVTVENENMLCYVRISFFLEDSNSLGAFLDQV